VNANGGQQGNVFCIETVDQAQLRFGAKLSHAGIDDIGAATGGLFN
jgi:hypothetical protein